MSSVNRDVHLFVIKVTVVRAEPKPGRKLPGARWSV